MHFAIDNDAAQYISKRSGGLVIDLKLEAAMGG